MSTSAEMIEKSFEPSRYLTKIPRRVRDSSGSWTTADTEYLEVKWRLLWLRTEHPDATIETEMISHEAGMAVFRARVSIADGGSATGWGHETASDFEDYLEKAETKALGRALAALGYGTQFCEDFDFEFAATGQPRAAGQLRVVDSPILHPGGESQSGPGSVALNGVLTPVRGSKRETPPATEPQLKAIYAIARGALALDEDALDGRCRDRYGVAPQELNRRQASEFIDALKTGAATSLG